MRGKDADACVLHPGGDAAFTVRPRLDAESVCCHISYFQLMLTLSIENSEFRAAHADRGIGMMRGAVVWLTGLSGAGKTTLATAVLAALQARQVAAHIIDGGSARRTLGGELGYGKDDRDLLVRRIGFLAGLLAEHGVVVLVAVTAPYRAARDAVRAAVPNYLEVFVRCPIEELMVRDEKGLYRQALSGAINHLPGATEVYEAPFDPDVVVDREYHSVQAGVTHILAALERRGHLPQAVTWHPRPRCLCA